MDSDKRLKWDENPNYKMKQGKQNIKQLLNEIVKNRDEIFSIVAKVTSVDESERTCDVEPLNGDAEIFGVRLQSDIDGTNGFVMIPAVDSNVIVTFLNNTTGFVSLCSSVEKIHVVSNIEMTVDCDAITFNGGSNDGLIKINDLVSKINAVENDINTLKSIFSAWVPAPTDGGAVLKTASTTWSSQTITPTQKTDIENDKIKH